MDDAVNIASTSKGKLNNNIIIITTLQWVAGYSAAHIISLQTLLLEFLKLVGIITSISEIIGKLSSLKYNQNAFTYTYTNNAVIIFISSDHPKGYMFVCFFESHAT